MVKIVVTPDPGQDFTKLFVIEHDGHVIAIINDSDDDEVMLSAKKFPEVEMIVHGFPGQDLIVGHINILKCSGFATVDADARVIYCSLTKKISAGLGCKNLNVYGQVEICDYLGDAIMLAGGTYNTSDFEFVKNLIISDAIIYFDEPLTLAKSVIMTRCLIGDAVNINNSAVIIQC